MLQELFLVVGCVKGVCAETGTAYLHYNHEQKVYIENIERYVSTIMPKYTPALAALVKGEVIVTINKNIFLTTTKNNANIKLAFEF